MAVERCEVSGCKKPVNRDGVCFRHKLLSVSVGTVPGGARDERSKISHGRNVERGLNRYSELVAAGESPSSITLEGQAKDSYKKMLWEKHGPSIKDENPPEKVKEVRKSLLNK